MPVFDEVRETICRKLKQSAIPPRLLLSRFRFIDEKSRYSRACMDPKYLPFYYYLGRNFPSKSLLDLSFGIGLNSGLYMMGNQDVYDFLAIQEPPPSEYYSPRIGVANIKQIRKPPPLPEVHVCPMYDERFLGRLRSRKWGVVLSSEVREYDTYLVWLNTVWDYVEDGGLICVDQTETDSVGRAYKDFCKVKHREPYVFPTRYGVGVVVR